MKNTCEILLALIVVLFIFIIFGILHFGIPYLWSGYTNKKFKERFPQYPGKYLWSLLFFPCFYIVESILMSLFTILDITQFEITQLYMVLVICIVMVIATIFIRKKSIFFFSIGIKIQPIE